MKLLNRKSGTAGLENYYIPNKEEKKLSQRKNVIYVYFTINIINVSNSTILPLQLTRMSNAHKKIWLTT